MTEIFVPGVGAHDNIGDAVLRRPLLRWLREMGRLHVYVGASSSSYDEALALGSADLVYTSFRSWMKRGLSGSDAQASAYVFKPGEVQLTLRGMKEHLGALPLALKAKASGGTVLRIGAGARDLSPVPRLLMWPSLCISDLTYWRDPDTAEYLGGHVMPDLAFEEGSSDEELEAQRADGPPRRRLVVTMRGDRPFPTQGWVEAVTGFAHRHGLEVIVVTQVRQDNARTGELAEVLDCEPIYWRSETHVEQEAMVRAQYRSARLVVSDRLHGLIMAMTEGAVPAAVLTDASRKIERHFSAIALNHVALTPGVDDFKAIQAFLGTQILREREILTKLASARTALKTVKMQAQQELSASIRPEDGHGNDAAPSSVGDQR